MDKKRPANKTSPFKLDIDHEDVKPGLLDSLVDHHVIEAECPDCGRVGYYHYHIDRTDTPNCKSPTCGTHLRL